MAGISGTAIAQIIAAVVAAAGAAVQYQETQDANDRQQSTIRNSLDAQERLQKEAEKKALDTADKFKPQDRLKEQAALEENITKDLTAPVSESQQIRAQQQTTQGDVSNDYSTAKAKSDLNTMKSAEALARLLGKTTSANRLRMNEGIRLLDAGQDQDTLANLSRGQQRADGIRIQQAGVTDPGAMFAGSLMQSLGTAYLGSGLGAAKPEAGSVGAWLQKGIKPMGGV